MKRRGMRIHQHPTTPAPNLITALPSALNPRREPRQRELSNASISSPPSASPLTILRFYSLYFEDVQPSSGQLPPTTVIPAATKRNAAVPAQKFLSYSLTLA